jgi:hypothetical protein
MCICRNFVQQNVILLYGQKLRYLCRALLAYTPSLSQTYFYVVAMLSIYIVPIIEVFLV